MTVTNLRTLTCDERNEYLGPIDDRKDWGIESSLTDLGGRFGEPKVLTVWYKNNIRIRDIRWPSPFEFEADVKPCEHHYWEGSEYDED
jgi:hypothetical protein